MATSATTRFNAKDFIADRVLPYSNQQIGGALGGPIIRDKPHYFVSYERENEPNTILTVAAGASRPELLVPDQAAQNSFLGRGDWQIGSNDHFTVRGSYWDWENPFTQVRGTEHPSQAADRSRKAINVMGSWSKVISSNVLQEVRVGYSHFDWQNLLAEPDLANSPTSLSRRLNVGQRRNYPQEFFQNTCSFRYDLSVHRGTHDISSAASSCAGTTPVSGSCCRAASSSSPHPPDLTPRFPADAWNDPSRWDLTGLDPPCSATT